MKKKLVISCRGEYFSIDESGNINASNGTWKFLGVSFHHWRNGIDIPFSKSLFDEPERLLGGMVWDLDHGTTRQWGGRYCGKLPRITQAFVR